MRLVATAGIIGIGVVIAAIMTEASAVKRMLPAGTPCMAWL
jgi:hypothetical protein